MGEKTAISWCDHTHNHWIGCMKLSPACDGCYAENLMDTRYGRVEWGAPGKGTGTRVLTSEANRRKPLTWNRNALAAGARPFVFCSSLADVFDNQIPVEWRRDLFDLIRATPQLVWLLLTKRPQNIVPLYNEAMLDPPDGGSGYPWPSNAAIGATVEDQERADKNVPALVEAKEALRPAFTFLSCEPLLGPLYIARWLPFGSVNGLSPREQPVVDWVITGGETDQGKHRARPTHPDWFRSIRDQCDAAGIPYHHKQNGEWAPWIPMQGNPGELPIQHVMANGSEYRPGNFSSSLQSMIKRGNKQTGRAIDGVEHDARPEVRP